MTTRQKPAYRIASVSYWAGDTWQLEAGTYATRPEAEAALVALREADFPLDLKVSRKYRVLTMSEVKREFGTYWHEHIRPPQPSA